MTTTDLPTNTADLHGPDGLPVADPIEDQLASTLRTLSHQALDVAASLDVYLGQVANSDRERRALEPLRDTLGELHVELEHLREVVRICENTEVKALRCTLGQALLEVGRLRYGSDEWFTASRHIFDLTDALLSAEARAAGRTA